MDVESNVPMEITLFLNSYLAWLLSNGLLQPAIATGMVNNISALQDTFNNLERIRNTPLPFAYQAHLRISLWSVTNAFLVDDILPTSVVQALFVPFAIPDLRQLQVLDHPVCDISLVHPLPRFDNVLPAQRLSHRSCSSASSKSDRRCKRAPAVYYS